MTVINAMEAELSVARKIFWLLQHDHAFLSSYNNDIKDWDDGAYPAINCSDLFASGADAEPLCAEDLDAFIAVVKRWPRAGDSAWCAYKRNSSLWREFEGSWLEEFKEAQAGIPKLLEELATFQEEEEQEIKETDELKTLLAWAYSKLLPYSFSKQEDALKMDEIKLALMQ